MEINSSSLVILQINKKLTSDKHFHKILQFQLNRINYFFPNSCYIYDQDNFLIQDNSNYDKIFSLKKDLMNFFDLNSNNQIILVDMINPMLDPDIIKYVSENIQSSSNSYQILGAIPGTAPKLISTGEKLKKLFENNHIYETLFDKIYYDSQRKHNTQFDLNRPLRVKIFSNLIDKIPLLHTLTIDEFLEQLVKHDIFNFVLDYGENIITTEINDCPNCDSKNLIPLYLSNSQAMIGFLPNSLHLYYECQNCALVIFRKQCEIDSIHHLYDEYERPKLNEVELISSCINNKGKSHFLEKIKGLKLVESLNLPNISMIDLGGGFGEFSCLAKTRNPSWDVTCADFDLSHVSNTLQQYHVKTKNLNFLDDDFGENYNLISALHVIEHIPFKFLSSFFTKIHNSLTDDGLLLITTPDYDSPLGKLFDYHLMYPPHHQTILSSKWISKFVEQKNLFRLFKQDSAAVLLENFDSWFSYYENTAPTDEFKSVIKLFNSIHDDSELFKNFHENIVSNNFGSETILLLQKFN